MNQQPNILFIMADQLAASFIGCYGSGVDSTPTLDRLAAHGRKYTRLYAHVPVCAPNRASILTGVSSELHGVVTNNLTLPPGLPTYPRVLRAAGYRTGGFGKFHHHPMQAPLPESMAAYGYDESVITEDTKLGPWLDWVEREHPEHYEAALGMSWGMPYITAYGPDRRDLSREHRAAAIKHREARQQASAFEHMHSSPCPKEIHQTTWITDRGLDFMRRHLDGRPDGQPFFCFVSYVDPHDPYDPPAPYDTMFNPDDMPDPIPMSGDGYRSPILDACRKDYGLDRIIHRPDVLRQLRAMYHGSIRFIDDQIARMVAFLKERGELDNTIIVFATDHGDMMGDHGFIAKGSFHYDACVRCPLIVAGPGVAPGVDERLVSSLDFFPTFCDWADVAARPPVEGVSFAAETPGRDVVTIQGLGVPAAANARSIVTEDGWRLTVLEDGSGQLFNLRADPSEQRDLYRDPAWTEKKIALLEQHAIAFMKPLKLHRYGNLTVKDGQRCETGLGFDFRPVCPDFASQERNNRYDQT